MEIRSKSSDRNLLLEFSGEMDHHGARNALKELEMIVDSALPKTLVLDMCGVTFMDSSGIALILRASRECNCWMAACWFVMCQVRPNVFWTRPGSVDLLRLNEEERT